MLVEKKMSESTIALQVKAVARMMRASRLRSASRVMRAGEQSIGTLISDIARPIWR